MARFTFQYQVVGKPETHTKSKSWKTLLGAAKAANKWLNDMAALDCPATITVGHIDPKTYEFIPLD